MDPWDAFRLIARDKRSGAAELAARTADALQSLSSDRDVVRAARRILRVHAPMGSLWRVFDVALRGGSLPALRERLESEAGAVAAAAAGWALPKRARVLTHSASSSVLATLVAAGPRRVQSVTCTTSLPGGEGRAFAARLRRAGFSVRIVADTLIARACADADVVMVGADAITPQRIVNKAGTLPLALTARETGVPCYVVAGTAKMVPDLIWSPDAAAAFDATPIDAIDALVTERGPMRAAGVRRAAGRVTLDPRLEAIAR